MQMPNTILKLVYKREFFDISTMRPGARLVTTINADGTVVLRNINLEAEKWNSCIEANEPLLRSDSCAIGLMNALQR